LNFKAGKIIFGDTTGDFTITAYLNPFRKLSSLTDNGYPGIQHVRFFVVNLEIVTKANARAGADYYFLVQD
jgi:hypothetical protein